MHIMDGSAYFARAVSYGRKMFMTLAKRWQGRALVSQQLELNGTTCTASSCKYKGKNLYRIGPRGLCTPRKAQTKMS